MTLAELSLLGAAFAKAEAENENPTSMAILRLLAFTGARKGEIVGLWWEEVDLDKGFLRLGVSKTGAKVVPLGAPALEVLAGVKWIDGSPLVFPGTSGANHFQGADKIWRKIRLEAGFPNLRYTNYAIASPLSG